MSFLALQCTAAGAVYVGLTQKYTSIYVIMGMKEHISHVMQHQGSLI